MQGHQERHQKEHQENPFGTNLFAEVILPTFIKVALGLGFFSIVAAALVALASAG